MMATLNIPGVFDARSIAVVTSHIWVIRTKKKNKQPSEKQIQQTFTDTFKNNDKKAYQKPTYKRISHFIKNDVNLMKNTNLYATIAMTCKKKSTRSWSHARRCITFMNSVSCHTRMIDALASHYSGKTRKECILTQ